MVKSNSEAPLGLFFSVFESGGQFNLGRVLVQAKTRAASLPCDVIKDDAKKREQESGDPEEVDG